MIQNHRYNKFDEHGGSSIMPKSEFRKNINYYLVSKMITGYTMVKKQSKTTWFIALHHCTFTYSKANAIHSSFSKILFQIWRAIFWFRTKLWKHACWVTFRHRLTLCVRVNVMAMSIQCLILHTLTTTITQNISSRFSRKYEAFASEYLENLEETIA